MNHPAPAAMRLPWRSCRRAALWLALAALLAGCWAPERYISRIRIERDGSYTLYAEGTAAHIETLKALRRPEKDAKGGKHGAEGPKKGQAEAQTPLQKELDQLKADKRVLSISPLDNGRVRFILSGAWSLDRHALIFSEAQAPLAYSVAPDGSMRVRVKDAVASREAQNLGLVTEGALSIVLAEGIEVLEHNAQKAPATPTGAYRWHIDGTTATAPYLKLRLPAEAQGKDAQHKVQQTGEPQAAPKQKGLAHR